MLPYALHVAAGRAMTGLCAVMQQDCCGCRVNGAVPPLQSCSMRYIDFLFLGAFPFSKDALGSAISRLWSAILV